MGKITVTKIKKQQQHKTQLGGWTQWQFGNDRGKSQ